MKNIINYYFIIVKKKIFSIILFIFFFFLNFYNDQIVFFSGVFCRNLTVKKTSIITYHVMTVGIDSIKL